MRFENIGTRERPMRRLTIGAVTMYVDTRDWWAGYYRSSRFHYVCPLPTLVFRWRRR